MKKLWFVISISLFIPLQNLSAGNSANVQAHTTTPAGLLYEDIIPLPILISEIFPRPGKGQAEFIELENSGGEVVKFSDLILQIGQRKYKLQQYGIFAPHSFFVLNQSDLPVSLRNSGQTVIVWDKYGRELIRTSYVNAPNGQSWSRTMGGAYAWSTQATPGQKNQLTKQLILPTVKVAGTNIQNKQPLRPKDESLVTRDGVQEKEITVTPALSNNLEKPAKKSSRNIGVWALALATATAAFFGLLASKKLL